LGKNNPLYSGSQVELGNLKKPELRLGPFFLLPSKVWRQDEMVRKTLQKLGNQIMPPIRF
jgi:hypothetical protein